jgi:hypothetical protein
MAGGHIGGHGAPVALHHQQLVGVALARQLAGEPAQIAIDHGLDESIDGSRRSALELAVLGEQGGPGCEVGVRPLGLGQLAGPALVRVVHVGVDEVDDQRFDVLLAQPGGGLGQRGQNTVGLVEHGRRHLGHSNDTGDLVDQHEVGEGAAHVHTDQERLPRGHGPFLYRGGRGKSNGAGTTVAERP